jgi:hypothetical protein
MKLEEIASFYPFLYRDVRKKKEDKEIKRVFIGYPLLLLLQLLGEDDGEESIQINNTSNDDTGLRVRVNNNES